MMVTTLGYQDTNARGLRYLSPDYKKLSSRVAEGYSINPIMLLEEEKGFGALFDIDNYPNLLFAREHYNALK